MSANVYDPKAINEADAITTTAKAKTHIQVMLAKHDGAKGMRLGVKKTGCSGYMYQLDIVTQPNADEHVFNQDDLFNIYVPQSAWPYVKGTCLDYREEGLNKKIVFENPKAQNYCGCGESFSMIDAEDEEQA